MYFGMLPVDPKSEEAQQLIPYTRSVLDALGMKHGPSHGEAIMTSSGPCLGKLFRAFFISKGKQTDER